jgi:hypothetical protein
MIRAVKGDAHQNQGCKKLPKRVPTLCAGYSMHFTQYPAKAVYSFVLRGILKQRLNVDALLACAAG